MRALLSVYDKKGIIPFAKGLVALGWELISTGGTYELLQQEGISVQVVEEITSFPEILNGRVKTLHPAIHAGILYKRDLEDHQKTMDEKGLHSIDMVVNNLYPFEETVKKTKDEDEILEMIDIGGPSMVRAAAKNYRDVLIVTDVKDYEEILHRLETGALDLAFRKKLSLKAFQMTAHYDQSIASYLSKDEKPLPSYRFKETLRYGENPHQQASFYEEINPEPEQFAHITQLHGKELSYNNLNDIYAAVRAVKKFEDCACVAVKHTNPCGIAIAKTPFEAYQKVFSCDSESIFGGIVAFNEKVDEKTASECAKTFLEVIIAPGFTEKALEIFKQKKNIRIIAIDNLRYFNIQKKQIKQVLNGIVEQDDDTKSFDTLQVMTKKKPSEEERKELLFAWEAVQSVQSNGVVICKEGATIGIGQGETKRAWAVEQAIERAGENIKNAVFASDGFFFKDTMELLYQAGIRAIIQPGGSVKDKEVIEFSDLHDMIVVFTGTRHFRH